MAIIDGSDWKIMWDCLDLYLLTFLILEGLMANGGYNVQVPKITHINKILIITIVAFFLLQSVLKNSGIFPSLYLGLSATGAANGHIYQLLTYPMMARGLMEVLFNCILLWFIGSELENIWGKRRYIKFLFSVIIGAGLIYLLISLIFFSGNLAVPLTGFSGVVNSLLLAYAILFPQRIFTFMLIFPIIYYSLLS